MMPSATHASAIAALNDELRRHGAGGMVVATAGLHALGSDTLRRVRLAVALFDRFDAGNDPYGEHDFGSVEVDGQQVFFKIDYYDADMRFQSADPSDPAVTRRVMTLLLADEY